MFNKEATHPLVSVVLISEGTEQQKANTRKSVEAQPPGIVRLHENSYVDDSGKIDLHAVTGSYILFLNSGDILEPEFGTEMQQIMLQNPDVVFLSCFLNPDHEHQSTAFKYQPWERRLSLTRVLRCMHLTLCYKLIRRELLPVRETPLALLMHAHLKSSDSIANELPVICRNEEIVSDTFTDGSSIEDKVCSYCADVAYMRAIARSSQLIAPNLNEKSIAAVLMRRVFEEGHLLVPYLPPFKALMLLLSVWIKGMSLFPIAGFSASLRAFGGSVIHALNDARKEKKQSEELSGKIAAVRQKPLIRVLFLVISSASWKNDSLMRAFMEHPRFDARVLVVPEIPLVDSTQRRLQMEDTQRYMRACGYPVADFCTDGASASAIPEDYDILFYPKPYEGVVPASLDFKRYRNRLWVCTTYGLHTTILPELYRTPFRDHAWMDCFENRHTAAVARRMKQARDNVVVTGLPFSDMFLFPRTEYPSPWKVQSKSVKKIIWAPHWTIGDKTRLELSCFLSVAEGMVALAQETEGLVQWALKPHPLLYQALCQHPEWGQERTDAYYALWERGENTQLETGNYVSLFTHSDAMVHDCSSFCCEYHHTAKPVMFLFRNKQAWLSDANSMARAAVEAHYAGSGMDDVRRFVYDTVLGNNDPLRATRVAFRAEYLIPPHGRSAAENIIDYILTGEANPSHSEQ